MGFRAFFTKEWYGSRKNIAVLLVLLVVLPGAAALGTAAFQQTIPEDIPIGVSPQDDAVTDDELTVIHGGTSLYASPQRYDSTVLARDALEREEVYLVIEVPHGLFDEDAHVNVTLVSDQRLAPFQEPANYSESAIAFHLDQQFPATVEVQHERIGERLTLSEYLVPTALLSMILLFAFLYLPLDLWRERDVFERVELTSRVETAVAAKLVFYGLLLVVPITVFQLVGYWLDHRVTYFSPQTFAIIALTFLYVSAMSSAIMFFTKLRRIGMFVNLGVMIAVFSLSSLVYPIGFFSTIRKEIALILPTRYSMVVTRSVMLKDSSLMTFNTEISWLLGITVLSVLLLQISIIYYRRQT